MRIQFARWLKQSCLAVILTALAMTASQAQQDNEYLGVHALFLSKYSTKSRTNLISVLTEKTAPSKIQVIFVPAFYTSGAGSASAWSNINEVVSKVNGSGRRITVGIALSFHATSTSLGSGSDTNTAVVYEKGVGRLAAFYQRHLQAITEGKVRVVILPSLEDQLASNDKFIALAKALVTKLSSELKERKVGGIDSVIVRRSVVSVDKRGTARELSDDCKKIAGTTGLGVSCQYQVHGPSRTGTVWSNDGIFVYADIPNLVWTEDKDSADNSETFAKEPRIPLTAFTASAAANSPVTTLWRPAFNLWAHMEDASKKVKYSKPKDKDNKELPLRKRSDSTTDPAFGEQEIRVVRYFLSNAPRR